MFLPCPGRFQGELHVAVERIAGVPKGRLRCSASLSRLGYIGKRSHEHGCEEKGEEEDGEEEEVSERGPRGRY